MTRENRNLIINALIALLVSVVLVMSYAFIKTGGKGSIYDDLFGFETSVEEKVDINKGSIKAKQEIKNKDKDTVGAVYTLSVEGEYYDGKTGTVVIDLVIKNDKSILAYEFVDYGHTDGFKANVEELLNAIVNDNKKLSDLDPSDASGTGSTNSGTLILNAFIELNTYLDGGSEEPGENPSDKFRDKHIVNEEQTADGYIFELDTKDVNYDAGVGNVVIKLTVNEDLTIKAYEFIEYNHTEGFRGNVEKLLNLFISEKVKLSDVKLSEDIAGSTRTSEALIKMFKGLSDYIEDVYGEGEEPEAPSFDAEAFKNDHVLYQRVNNVKDKEDIDNYVFILDSLDVEYRNGRYANFVISVVVNSDMTLKSYSFLDYNHTIGYQTKVIELLDKVIEEKIKLTELKLADDITGSTFSSNAVIELLKNLDSYIESGLIEDSKIDENARFDEKHILYRNNNVYVLNSLDIVYRDNGVKENFVIKVEVNNNLELVSYELVDYNHSGGGHKTRVIELLDGIVDAKTKITLLIDQSGGSQTTLSKNAVISILRNLGSFIEQREGAIDFNKDHVLYYEVNKAGNHVFILDSLDVLYNSQQTKYANFVIMVEVNKNLELVSYKFADYNHTSSMQKNVIEMLDQIITDKVELNELEDFVGGGTTLSKNAVIDLLRRLADYIEFGIIDRIPAKDDAKFEDKHILYSKVQEDGSIVYLLDSLKVPYMGPTGASANFVIRVHVSADLELLSYDFIVYNHTDFYKEKVDTMLTALVAAKTKLTDLEDAIEGSGSTTSKNAVINLLRNLGSRILEIRFAEKFSAEQVIYQNETNNGYLLVIDSLDVAYRINKEGVISYANFIIKLQINKDLELVSYEFVEYNHTPGFQGKVIELLDQIIADKLKLDELVNAEAGSGSTYSKNAVIKVIRDAVDYINAGFIKLEVKPGDTFKDKHILNEHTVTEKVENVNTEFKVFTLDSLDVAYRDNGSKANFVLKVKLDENLVLIDYSFIDYNHTERYQGKVIELLDKVVEEGLKISELKPVDAGSGSTFSSNAVIKLLKDLATYIGGE